MNPTYKHKFLSLRLKATFNIFKSYAIHPIKLMHKQERKKKNVYVFQEQEPARKRTRMYFLPP